MKIIIIDSKYVSEGQLGVENVQGFNALLCLL